MGRDRAKIAGLVLAAGYSTRMGSFKPLLSFGDSTVIEKAVGSILLAGVQDVRVVVGWRGEELLPVLDRLGVKAVFNPHYDRGMYSSVVVGNQSLGPEIEAFLLLPGDHPLVRPETIQSLIDCYLQGHAGIVYPRFRQRRGHPPLIAKKYVESASTLDQPGGLRAVLRQHESDAVDVDTEDQGVVTDLDVVDDYTKALTHFHSRP